MRVSAPCPLPAQVGVYFRNNNVPVPPDRAASYPRSKNHSLQMTHSFEEAKEIEKHKAGTMSYGAQSGTMKEGLLCHQAAHPREIACMVGSCLPTTAAVPY